MTNALHAARLPYPRVAELASANAVALLPVGSTEAHGPHLPLNVDVVIAEEVARRLSLVLASRGEVALIFPAVAYGLTDFAAAFSGTISVSAAAARAFLTDVMAGIAQHGFRRIVVLNHHLEPDHFKLVHEAAQEARTRTGAGIAVPDHRKKPTSLLLGEEFVSGGSHAGRYETSLMLAAAPELVREERAALPDLNVNLPAAIKQGAKTFHECGGAHAYFGSPASATGEEGERLFEAIVAASLAAVLALP